MVRVHIEFESGEPTRTITCELADAPFQHDGRPGSLLDMLLGHAVPLEHACGGSCACTTCHVIVRAGAAQLTEADEQEEDMLDRAPGLTPTSRLGCQAVVIDPNAEITVRIPRHTVNQISGSHGG